MLGPLEHSSMVKIKDDCLLPGRGAYDINLQQHMELGMDSDGGGLKRSAVVYHGTRAQFNA